MNGNTAHPGTNKNTFTNVDLKLIYQCDACILICNIVVFNYFKIKYVFFQRLKRICKYGFSKCFFGHRFTYLLAVVREMYENNSV